MRVHEDLNLEEEITKAERLDVKMAMRTYLDFHWSTAYDIFHMVSKS